VLFEIYSSILPVTYKLVTLKKGLKKNWLLLNKISNHMTWVMR